MARQIGKYEIIGELGALGAQGDIFQGRYEEKDFILKAPRDAARRHEEILAWKRASNHFHPHVLDLLEVFEEDGKTYLVSRFLTQGTLKDRLAQEKPTQAQALQIFRGIVAGLAHVHRLDLTHRDLKPGNILLAGLHPFLMDFGLSRITQGTVLTQMGVGTPEYAPPELAEELHKLRNQWSRRSNASIVTLELPISKRGDVWSVGVILYEMLFEELPFTRIDDLCNPNLAPPDLDNLPPPLAELLRLVLVKNKDDRLANGEVLETTLAEMERKLSAWELETALAPERQKREQAEEKARLLESSLTSTNNQLSEAREQLDEVVQLRKRDEERLRHAEETAQLAQAEQAVLERRLQQAQQETTIEREALAVEKRRSAAEKARADAAEKELTTVRATLRAKTTTSTTPLLDAYKAEMVQIPAGVLRRSKGTKPVYEERPVQGVLAKLQGKTEQVEVGTEPVYETVGALRGFKMGKTPVTVGMWQEFCAATKREMPKPPEYPVWAKGWDAVRDHPIVRVSWEDCNAYADWAGLALPTEAQWEYAASGGDGRMFPWGNDWDASKCQCSKAKWGDSGGTSRVGSYPAGAFGLYDMAGNVREWCADWYDEAKTYRSLRGGSWYNNDANYLRCAYRDRNTPDYRVNIIGFRLSSPGPR